MPARTRSAITPTDDWSTLQLRFDWPEQTTYELIRPVVLFGSSPLQRAEQTGVSSRTIYRRVARFDQLGMQGLFEADEPAESRRALPSTIRRVITQLKAEYPAFRINELATICYVRFNRRPGAPAIKRVLAEETHPAVVSRRFPPCAEIVDPIERRAAIVRLHAEGWNIASIAGYLQTSRPTIYATLQRWIAEGVRGLDDKSSAPKHPAQKTDLQTINLIRKLQRNPELGEFRMHAALLQLGIRLSPRTCGRILSRNRKLYGLRGPEAQPRAPKVMPFKAERRHQYWTVDLRYLDHQLGDGNVYCISILENYSRAVLASGISRSQDLTAFLRVLHAAVRRYGAPEALVSDHGSIFLAKQARAIYRSLQVTKEEITLRQPWQSYIETTFNIQRRMADWGFVNAQSWEELLAAHEQWVGDFNYQVHWAHRQRNDGRRSPAEVLGWVLGRQFTDDQLQRIFTLRVTRQLDQQGYARFRHWRIYGERGLVKQRAMVWLYEEHLTLQFLDEPLSEYRVTYERGGHRLHAVTNIRLYETQHQSPQPLLFALRAEEWRLALPLPGYKPQRRRSSDGFVQPALFPDA